MTSVLVTGGSGSFGQAFIRKLLDRPGLTRVAVYSRGEHAQEEMAKGFTDERMRFFIGDVRDESRLELAMRGVDMVIHAAALKIVPTAEYNPTECIETNVHGAMNVVKAAIRAGVARVVALSTDKAVNPVNLYGASKLAAEKVFVAANNLAAGDTLFSVVRYGNVYGSRGSVAPLFKSLAAKDSPIPITDARMTRFNITMDEAVTLVLKTMLYMRGREIVIPKIPSFKITDLAKAIAPNSEQKIVGIRPGEKLHEVLLTEDESRSAYDEGDCYVIDPDPEADKSRSVPEGFRYTSDTNDQWLSVEQLAELVK